jgi:hypothetical protein
MLRKLHTSSSSMDTQFSILERMTRLKLIQVPDGRSDKIIPRFDIRRRGAARVFVELDHALGVMKVIVRALLTINGEGPLVLGKIIVSCSDLGSVQTLQNGFLESFKLIKRFVDRRSCLIVQCTLLFCATQCQFSSLNHVSKYNLRKIKRSHGCACSFELITILDAKIMQI